MKFFNFIHSRDSNIKDAPRLRYFTIPLIRRFLSIQIAYTRNYEKIKVISSKVKKEFRTHVFLADIDAPIPLDTLIFHLNDFASRFSMSNIYVIKTRSGGYHLYSLKTLGYQNYLKMLVYCPFIDFKFISWTSRNRKSHLRVSGKDLEFQTVLERNSKNESGSNAHKLFLEQRFGIEIKENLTWEGSSEAQIYTKKIPK